MNLNGTATWIQRNAPCDHLGIKGEGRSAWCCEHNRYFPLRFEVSFPGQGRHIAVCCDDLPPNDGARSLKSVRYHRRFELNGVILNLTVSDI